MRLCLQVKALFDEMLSCSLSPSLIHAQPSFLFILIIPRLPHV
jgi:hypothetical protein